MRAPARMHTDAEGTSFADPLRISPLQADHVKMRAHTLSPVINKYRQSISWSRFNLVPVSAAHLHVQPRGHDHRRSTEAMVGRSPLARVLSGRTTLRGISDWRGRTAVGAGSFGPITMVLGTQDLPRGEAGAACHRGVD